MASGVEYACEYGCRRSVLHRVLPVRVSSATTKLSSKPSQLTISRSPASSGEPPLPCCDWYGSRVFHRIVAGRRHRGRALGAEVHVDAIAVDDRRRRGVAVLRVRERRSSAAGRLRRRAPAGRSSSVERQQAQRGLALHRRRRGQPHAPAGDDRRRPAAAGHRDLPRDVLRFAPLDRQPALRTTAPGRRARGTAASLPCPPTCPPKLQRRRKPGRRRRRTSPPHNRPAETQEAR